MAECWLSTVAGLHVPFTPLLEVDGKDGTLAPAQIVDEVPKPKTGTTVGFTVTLKVIAVAHCPPFGVNV